MRHLLSTRRHVPLDVADDYLAGWATVRAVVESAGGRAWIFRGAAHEDRFIEFIEWTDASGAPLEQPAVAAAMAELDGFAVATASEEWEEMP